MNCIRSMFGILCVIQMLGFSPLNADPQKSKISSFALITIPKAGSHLAIKTLNFMTGGIAIWHTRFLSSHCIPGNEGFLYTHLCLSPQLEHEYAQLRCLKKIIMVRDMRDVCVSVVNQIRKTPWPGMNSEQREAFLKLSFADQLLFVINYDYDVNDIVEQAPNSLQVSMQRVAEQAERFCADPSNLFCFYENLVGEKGGGSRQAQMEELRKLANFLTIPISNDRLGEIADQIYGNEVDPFGKDSFQNFCSTFHQGKIGNWKNYFSEEHKQAFKLKLGKFLIVMGYEMDYNW
jgi:sulfotransferase 6B1